MARAHVRGLTFFRTVLFLPQVIALVVVAVMWRMIYDPQSGALNEFLGRSGSAAWRSPGSGTSTSRCPRSASSAPGSRTAWRWCCSPPACRRSRQSLYDAARVDGAGPVREFVAVTLPGLRGEIAVALTLTTIAALRNFDLIYITTSGGPGDATSVPAFEVYDRAFQTGQTVGRRRRDLADRVIFALAFSINRIAERGGAMIAPPRAGARLRRARRVLADRARADRRHRVHGAAGPGGGGDVRRVRRPALRATSRTPGEQGTSARTCSRARSSPSPSWRSRRCCRSSPATRSA